VVAFIVSLLISFALVGVIIRVARNRPVGTPLTWGEAFLAGLFVFFLLFLLYGVVPHQFLAWADSGLKWRSDKIGIPLGPLGGMTLFGHHFKMLNGHLGVQKGLLFPNGIPLPHGHFIVTAQVLRDIIAATLYIVFLLGQIKMWLWWQKRDKQQAATPELTSAYGRPLVRGS
jgi:hypothetical protein